MSVINTCTNNQCHLIGDFNLNLYNSSSKNVNSYLDCIFSNNLFPVISRATHFKGHNPTCIDHILTNNISDTKLTGIILNNISHHMPVFSIISSDSTCINPNHSQNFRPIINEHTLHGFINDFKIITSKYDNMCAFSSPIITASDIFDNFLTKYNLKK